jgi:hypothetical protein
MGMPLQTAFTVVFFYALVIFLPAAALALWRWPGVWPLLLAAYLGLTIGLSDVRGMDPQGTVLSLLTLGLFLGFVRPVGAWRWALALSLWVPGLGLLAHFIGLTSEPLVNALFSSVAVLPALIGVYAGAFVRRAAGARSPEAA